MKTKVLNLLSENSYVSGESISEALGISRAAVWKYINILKKEGYIIDSSTNKGYIVLDRPDVLTSVEVSPFIRTEFVGKNIVHFNTISSTNTKAKELAADNCPNGTVIISEEQTSGRGRLGRQWVSPKCKGIWMSIILRPDIPPMEAYKVTIIAAAAVHGALAENGADSLIKWPNDIIMNGKKVCGILTEMNSELSKIHYLVIGIGINVNTEDTEIPEELKDKASSLKLETNRHFDRKLLLGSILNNFEPLYKEFTSTGSIETSIAVCRDHSAVLNREVILLEGNKSSTVKVVDINSNGHLLIQESDAVREILSGEVSIRAKEGYI
ncbi:biotin--[acetyl-CoA-carboxylase] ligase [Clostridium thermarum]|uniref:biotin--[acetyl-CoA-carboxylase] ligase n=1 Tax=Clostridium thermarum TaxID=1716543 RepID=UPI0013D1E18F|nr:biotin--[acetyl-CoA-carboxylase] ligase [Clostridium thermarum]